VSDTAAGVAGASERIRLFVALELPEPVRGTLLRWRSSQRSVERLRPVAPDALHATLCFLGWRPAGEVEAIGAAVASVVRGGRVAELALGSALWLPRRRPRVLAVEIEDSSRALSQLQAALSEALSGGGWYEPEKRPYLGHVTVARVPARTRVRALELPSPPRLEFLPTAVTLYRSRLERAGARYEALTTLGL
jgi:RNA 2',3'-cyclic 3'-phosphodiesterase